MGERDVTDGSPAHGSGPSPFAAFGIAAAIAAVGAVWEMSYYAGNSALSAGDLGTTLGIVVALVAFYVWGVRAPPNE